MIIVGVDFHPSVQQVAFLDTETGETGERRLNHSDGEAERSIAIYSEDNEGVRRKRHCGARPDEGNWRYSRLLRGPHGADRTCWSWWID